MASGALIADALGKGLALGQNARELGMKQKMLMQEQAKEKMALYSKRLEADIGTLKATIEGMPDRSDPNAVKAIDTYKDQLMQTAKIIGTLNPQLGQQYQQLITLTYTNTKDKATQFTEAATNKQKEVETNASMYAKALAGGQPTAGATAPTGPAAPPAGPAMAPANQQVAMEPQAGLTSQATAEPAMPMPQVAPEMASQSVTAPAPMGGPMPAPAAAPMGGGQDEASIKRMLMQRAAEAAYPKSSMDQKMDEGKVKKFFELQSMADTAQEAVKSNARARQLLEEGIYTGISAKAGLLFSKVTGNDPAKVKRTEEFLALLGKTIGPQLKMFGSATAISNLDLTTVEQYIGKDITLNKESIDAILSMNQMGAENSINTYNRYAPGVGGDPIQVPNTEPTGQSGFAPDKDGWISLNGARIRLKPGQ